MRRSSSIASSFRSICTYHGTLSASATSNHRLLQAALFSSATAGGSHTHRRWFSSVLDSVAGGSTRAASFGVVGAVASLAAAVSMSQEVYAKEPLRQELVPKEVVLYQYEACPFCNKVKAFLDYYDIPYKVVEVNPFSKKEIKWSEYKKVPILVVDGEQLVDSSAIIDQLSHKVLSDKNAYSVSEDDEETKWRQWVDNHLVHVLSPNIYRNTSKPLSHLTTLLAMITVKYAGAAAMYFVSKKLKKKYNITDERAALYEAAETWVDALNGQDFLGGSKPNLADLAVFGVLRPIRYLRSGKDMVEHTRIGEWYTRMESTVGDSSRIRS